MTTSDESLRRVALVGYALQASTPFTGGLGLLVAVVIAYIKRDDAVGTLYGEHLRWQIATFWQLLVFSVLAFVLSLVTIGIGAPIFFGACLVWMIYRVAKGWLALNDSKSPYPAAPL